jgi:hypothetical protein
MKAFVRGFLKVIATVAAFAAVAGRPIAAHAESVTLSAVTLTGAGPNNCSLTVAIYPSRVSGIVYYRQANDTVRAVNTNVLDFLVRVNTADKTKVAIANKVGTLTAVPGTFTEGTNDPINVLVDVTADANKNWVNIVVKGPGGEVLKTISGSPSSETIRVKWTP